MSTMRQPDRSIEHGESAEGHLNIGQVMELLVEEHPTVSIPKLRFLENKGLIAPQRTQAGYRKFSDADVERLRYILRMQRDYYLPLKVIGEHLDAMDRGLEPPPIDDVTPTVPTVELDLSGLPGADTFAQHRDQRLSRRELLKLADVSEELLGELEAAGLVTAQRQTGFFTGDALFIVHTAKQLAQYGVEVRHLRAFRTSADREVGLIKASAAGHPGEVEHQLAALSSALHVSLVRAGLRGA